MWSSGHWKQHIGIPEVLGKKFYELQLLHVLVQRVLLLANEEAIFIKPQVSSHEKISPNWK